MRYLLADHNESGSMLGGDQALSATERHIHSIQFAQW